MFKRILLICFFLSGTCHAQDHQKMIFHHAVPYCKGGTKDLLLDVIEPLSREKKRKALLFVHGGGWVAGSREDYHFLMKLAALQGYVAFGADYRLATEAVFPAQIEDLKCAVRWIRAHADEYAVDTEKVGAVGASAGAHLVAMLGATNQKSEYDGQGGYQEYSDDIQAMILHGGVYDLTQSMVNRTIREDARGVVNILLGARAAQNPESFVKISPIFQITKDAPPTLLLHGEDDPIVFAEQSVIMGAYMKEIGANVDLVVIPKSGHGDFGQNPEEVGKIFFYFLQKNLNN